MDEYMYFLNINSSENKTEHFVADACTFGSESLGVSVSFQ